MAGFGLNLSDTTAQAATLPCRRPWEAVTPPSGTPQGQNGGWASLSRRPDQLCGSGRNYLEAQRLSAPASSLRNTSDADIRHASDRRRIAGIFTPTRVARGPDRLHYSRKARRQPGENVYGFGGWIRSQSIDLDPATDNVFVVLFGTGIRGRSALSAVTASVVASPTGGVRGCTGRFCRVGSG